MLQRMWKVMRMANKKIKIAKTATEALIMLWQGGFFRTWQAQPKIVAHLAGKEHNFEGPELGMALKRAKYLTRRGTRGCYEYIQTYPFVAEELIDSIK
jgi:hypothetical protein